MFRRAVFAGFLLLDALTAADNIVFLPTNSTSSSSAQQFIVYNRDTTTYPYTVHLPDRLTRNLPPLITPPPVLLSLSGSGARGPVSQAAVLSGYDGASRKIQEYNRGFRTPAHQLAAEEFLTITPICPNDVPQNQANWDSRKMPAILAEVVKTYEVDLTRVYLSGYSMGARGAWDLLIGTPGVFAGVVIASGATYVGSDQLTNVVGVPIRNFVGSNDDSGLAQSANRTYAAIMQAASSMQTPLSASTVSAAIALEIVGIPGADHSMMTNRPWDSDVVVDGKAGGLDWLLSQSRPQGALIPGVDLDTYPSYHVINATAAGSQTATKTSSSGHSNLVDFVALTSCLVLAALVIQ